MNSFDSKNPRVRHAKMKRNYNNPIFIAFAAIVLVALLVGGAALLFLHNSLAWTLFGLAALPGMLIYWIKHALANIPIGKSDDITDLLSEDLLLFMNDQTTPQDLIAILPKTRSGTFIMARFTLTVPFFEELVPFLPPALEPVFEAARAVRTETNSEAITGAVLVVALLRTIPNYDILLSQLQLSPEDLNRGVTWFNYLNGLVLDSKKPVHSGGIARDFAFGFTPTLQRFAVNLSDHSSGAHTQLQQADHEQIINQMVDTFTKGGRQNVALIGSEGCGRATIVSVFAETLMNADSKIPRSLKYRQIYSLDVPSIISAAKNPGDLEHLMINIFNEIYSAKNIILCLNDAHLFFEEGSGSVDIANMLNPVLEAGSIRMILIMDEQKYLEISAKNPSVANSLNKIVVTPTGPEETLKVLMDQVPLLELQKGVIYTYRALTEAYRLSEQYIHDVEMPGKAKLLLESAASYANNNVVTAESVGTAVEKSYGVKVKVATEAEDRDKLLNLEQLIHDRMVDQTEAVSAVANALRRAAAGVKNTGRPIGTFLFLGPTGVGKTELAKTLSDVYFGGEGNLIRLDMNEFVTADDVSRLIRDGAADPLSLTAQVSKHPFSVILLDEIEKAHSSVLTTLLQVLDEGILRDEKNREISFRDSIIIATSNAGANTIREKIIAGEQIADFKESFIEDLIASDEFKRTRVDELNVFPVPDGDTGTNMSLTLQSAVKEMNACSSNRFDEICLFKPLSKEDLVQILDLIIASTNKTLEPQKISVVVDPAAKQVLIDQGYDPKMGARPMRRIVQKTVENITAAAILSGKATPGSTLTITPNEINIQ